nr:transglycosylase SLT domain-containing protein [Halomonas olivaria]
MWWWGDAHAAYRPDIPEAYAVAAETHSVPPDILYALALNESQVQLAHAIRPWPWTLNVAGTGYHFADRNSACEALYEALGRTRVVDVGIAQLNVRWQPQLFGAGNRFVDPCDALDPYANLEEAAGLLRQHYEESGDWLMAAGRYHRPAGGEAAARYRRGIAAQLARLEAGSGPRPASHDAAVRFASASDIELPATTQSVPQPPSIYSANISEHYQPIAIDHSLHWVVPSEVEPVSWIDPEVRWDWLVSVVVQ